MLHSPPCPDVHQQLQSPGWELIPLRLAQFHSKCPLARLTVTSKCLVPRPPPKKISGLQKIWRIILYSTYGRLKGLVPVGQLGCETPCYWILPDPIPNLIGSSGTPTLQVSVVLFHPVPTFITVLPVLFSFDDLSVAPAEESHLSQGGGKEEESV